MAPKDSPLDNLKNNLGVTPPTPGTNANARAYNWRGNTYLGNYYSMTKPTQVGERTVNIAVPAVPTNDAYGLIYKDRKLFNKWQASMKKYGMEVRNELDVYTTWENAVFEASKIFQASEGRNKVTPEDYLKLYSRTQETAAGPKKPSTTRNVYMSDPATVRELIDTTVKNVLGRKATQSEMTDFYGAIEKMMKEGTVTTTKTSVRNGVPETVVTTTPKFSQKMAEAKIEETLKAKSPQDYAEKKSLDFLDFLFGGGQ